MQRYLKRRYKEYLKKEIKDLEEKLGKGYKIKEGNPHITVIFRGGRYKFRSKVFKMYHVDIIAEEIRKHFSFY
jgi:phosphoenolpyruvate synthase/pyruvate phosphate dikinase